MPSNQRIQQQLYGYKNVTVTAVDTSTGIVDAIDAGMQNYRILMGLYNNALAAVPAVGEAWLIKKVSGGWELYSRYENNNMNTSLANMAPGDQRIDASGNLFVSASAIIFSDGAMDQTINGSALIYPIDMLQYNLFSNQDLIITMGTQNLYPTFSISQRLAENDVSIYFGGGTAVADVAINRSGPGTLTITGNLNVTGIITQNAVSPYAITGYSTERSVAAGTATTADVINILATLINDLGFMTPPAQAPSGGTVTPGTAWTINIPTPFVSNDMSSLPTVWHSS